MASKSLGSYLRILTTVLRHIKSTFTFSKSKAVENIKMSLLELSKTLRVESEVVRSLKPIPEYVTALTPIDQFMPRLYVTRFVLAFPLRPDTDQQKVYLYLKQGLERTLTDIPFLGGHIVPSHGGKGRVQIHNGPENEILFRCKDFRLKDPPHAHGTTWYAHWREANHPLSCLNGDVISPVGIFPEEAKAAVMAVQANFFEDGVLLTACMHHSATDALGFSQVLKTWAKHAKSSAGNGFEVNGLLPAELLERSAMMKGAPSSDVKDCPEYIITSPEQKDLAASESDRLKDQEAVDAIIAAMPPMTAQIFHFSHARLAQLKADASSINAVDQWISTNDALSALLWKHICLARGLPEGTASSLVIAVDTRGRVRPQVPNPYLGNASLFCPVPLKINTIGSQKPLYDTAMQVRRALQAFYSDRIKKVIGVIDSLEDIKDLNVTFKHTLGNDVVVTSWADLGLYEEDWGPELGFPEAVRMPSFTGDGACAVLPRLRDKGLEVLVTMEVEAMERLKADDGFARYAEWRCS